ncbi:MAG TPA: hypothetical protein VNB64_12215 [Solirubrobacteraceae bacterium]|nr:hypothetical protein [Solirubrobacteraceae bacterium]
MGHNAQVSTVFAEALQDAFWPVLLVVVVGAGLVAIVTFIGSGRLYDQIGRGGLSLNEDAPYGRRGAPAAQEGAGVREDEIRQMLAARNEHRARRGQAPLDVEDELRRLTATQGGDPALRAEIRQLVVARNERRVRAGKAPLDVEAEVEREIERLA